MYPMTGVIPPRIELPQAMLPPRKPSVELPAKPETKTVGVGSDEKLEQKESSTQTDPETVIQEIEQAEVVFANESFDPISIIAPPAAFSEVELEAEELIEYEEVELGKNEQVHVLENVKILNKSKPAISSPPKQFKRPSQIKIERVDIQKPKILNRQLQQSKFEVTMVDTIETTEDGNLQIVSLNEEYLDDTEWTASVKSEPQDKSDDGVVYTCSVCDRSFPLAQQLQIHQKNHDRERNHPCESCDKSFFTKYDLAKHILTHTKQKDYTCIVCKKSFSRSTLLYRHEKIHTDPKIPRHHCEECDRIYLNIRDYEKHIQIHTKNRRFECSFCEKRFAFKQGLERHQTIHDNESQPHGCLYCELRFPSAARLQRHLSNEHAGKRPFPCSKCSKRFMLSHHLYRHMRTTHDIQQVYYRCPQCEVDFGDREEFFTHCIEHAEDSLDCPLCKASFELSNHAVDHVHLHEKSDMHYCDYCNLIFMTSDELNQHFDDEHSNELCSIGEEVGYVVQENVTAKKRKVDEAANKSITKKTKNNEMISYAIQEIDNDNFEFLNDDRMVISDISGAAFVEYEEVETSYDEPESLAKPVIKQADPKRKTYARSSKEIKPQPQPSAAAVQVKKLPAKVERVKMSQAKIEQLKKEGKIKIVNGEMIMKS